MVALTKDIYLDSEYKSGTYDNDSGKWLVEGFPICVQVSFGERSKLGVFVFWNKLVIPEGSYLGKETGMFKRETDIFYDPATDNPVDYVINTLLADDIPNLRIDPRYQVKDNPPADISLDIHLHYSPKDLEYFLGRDAMWTMIARNMLEQKRGLKVVSSSGFHHQMPLSLITNDKAMTRYEPHRIACDYDRPDAILKLSISDTYAYCSKSLNTMAGLVGSQSKLELDWDKSDMIGLFRHNPDLFREYALRDVILQERVSMSYPKLYKSLFHQSIPAIADNEFKVRGTMGSNVAEIIKQRVEALHPDLLDTFALIRGGERSLKDPVEARAWDNIAGANAKVLARKASTGIYGAFVNGGRCRNEQPWRTRAENVLDVDMSGCYSTALKDMLYPVGLPTILEYDHQQLGRDNPTLKEFLKRVGSELIDNLWVVIVDGGTSFPWDLIPSFITTPAKIRRSVENPDGNDDIRRIDGDFHYATNEVKNGIITSRILEIIKSVATTKELSEILALRVKTALYYSNKDRKETPDGLVESIKTRAGSITMGMDKERRTATLDDRNRAWYGLPLSEIITNWADERKRHKAMSKDPTLDADTRAIENSLQEHMKLGINSVYGVLVSPYFKIGNTIIANNITANARVGVWMMSKALGSFQSITDGGTISIDEVRYQSGKKAGLAVLADQRYWQATTRHSSRYSDVLVKTDNETWDSVVERHIASFWAPYGLSLGFSIECKSEGGKTLAKSVGLMNKADYSIAYDTDIVKTKKRGYKPLDDADNDIAPAPIGILEAFSNDENIDFSTLAWSYDQKTLCKIASSGIEAMVVPIRMAGDEVVSKRKTKLIPRNLSFQTIDETEAWLEYWDRAPSGLEALARNTGELSRVLDELHANPWGLAERHRLATNPSKAGRKLSRFRTR